MWRDVRRVDDRAWSEVLAVRRVVADASVAFSVRRKGEGVNDRLDFSLLEKAAALLQIRGAIKQAQAVRDSIEELRLLHMHAQQMINERARIDRALAHEAKIVSVDRDPTPGSHGLIPGQMVQIVGGDPVARIEALKAQVAEMKPLFDAAMALIPACEKPSEGWFAAWTTFLDAQEAAHNAMQKRAAAKEPKT